MTRDEYLKEIDNVSSFDKEAVLKIVQISKLYIKSLEEQIQGLQSLLDFKQQEISVLESKVCELEANEEKLKREWYVMGSNDNFRALLDIGAIRNEAKKV